MATSTPQKMLEQPEISSAPSRPAWGVVPMLSGSSVEGPSLSEVMSEQLAKEIQKKEKDLVKFEIPPELLVPPEPASPTAIAAAVAEEDSCADDLLIAQMLQMQFDQESDKILKNEERAANKDSKVTISYSKYKMIPDNGVWEESEEEDEYFTVDEQKRRLDDFQEDEYELEDMPRYIYLYSASFFVFQKDDVRI